MRNITFAEAVREALREAMLNDPSVFLMGEDVGVYGGVFGVSKGLLEEFGPERVKDTPISEAAIAGAAAGAALYGMRPVAEIMFCDFSTIAMDALVNQAAKMRYMSGGKTNVPMVLRTTCGSGTGAAAQHSQSLEAWFCHVPGLKVVMPSTPYDAKGLLLSAVNDGNPVIFFEPKILYKTAGSVPDTPYSIPLGKADIKRAGTDITLITYGSMLPMCLSIADEMAKRGIHIEVADPRTLIPLDKEALIASAKKTGRVLIVHEAALTGGYGGEIAAIIAGSEAFYSLKCPIRRLCGADVPIPFSPGLERLAVPGREDIIHAIEQMLDDK